MTEQSQVSNSPSETPGKVSFLAVVNRAGQLDRDAIQDNMRNPPRRCQNSKANYCACDECSRVADANRAYKDAGLPVRQRMNVPGEDHAEWYAALEKCKDKLGDGFIIALLGNRGTGKTQIAAGLIRAACAGGIYSCRYTLAFDFFLELRHHMKDGKGEDHVIREYTKSALLVIDEADVRGHSEWEDRNLTHLIDKRYGAMLDTLLISNSLPDRFVELIGPSVSDRLRECGGVIECNWKSFRGN